MSQNDPGRRRLASRAHCTIGLRAVYGPVEVAQPVGHRAEPETDRPNEAADRMRLTAALTREAAALSHHDPRTADADRLAMVVTLYGGSGPGDVETSLAAFVAEQREILSRLFAAYAADPRADTLLASDVLLVFERLEHDPDRLRALWQRHRPLDELEELASVFGVAI